MPEGLEIEYYRRAAEAAIGRTITAVDTPDAWYLKRDTDGAALRERLIGASFSGAFRIGKLLLLEDGRSDLVLGLRFGMTGVLEVDGARAIEKLQYSSTRHDPTWIRFAIRFGDGGGLFVRDPRRLGGVELDPDVRGLGPDALDLTPAALRAALAGSEAPLKARLMDQRRVAGLGNLLTDEILWRSGLDPARPAGSLTPAELRRLQRHLRITLDELMARGGSHTGDLMEARIKGALCPRCGTPVQRRTIGGRTTISCPKHQR